MYYLLAFVSIYPLFDILKPFKHFAITSLSQTLKRGRLVFQLISLLCTLKMGHLLLQAPLFIIQFLHLLSSFSLSESLPLIRKFDDSYLIYKIYLTLKSLAHYYLKMFYQIIVLYIRFN